MLPLSLVMDGNLQHTPRATVSQEGAQAGSTTRLPHQRASALTPWEFLPGSSGLNPSEGVGMFHVISQEHPKLGIFISTHVHRFVGDSQNPLRSRAVRFKNFTSLTFPQKKLQSSCTHSELHLLPSSSSDELLPPNKSSSNLSAFTQNFISCQPLPLITCSHPFLALSCFC